MKQMKQGIAAVGLAFLALATPTLAADKAPCQAGMVCASNPQSLVDALQAAGYKAKLTKDSGGDPKIESATGGHNYSIYFYDCDKGTRCGSIQFSMGFEPEDDNTAAYANRWNVKKRMIRASVNDKKELYLNYDLSTIGGLNKTNFTDVVEWWVSMIDDFNLFVKENAPTK